MAASTRLSHALCPPVGSGSANRLPKLFRSESAAKRFLNSEFRWRSEKARAEATGMSVKQVRARMAEHEAQRERRTEQNDVMDNVPSYSPRFLNRERWDEPPVRVCGVADHIGPKCPRYLREFLPADAVAGAMPELTIYGELLRALEERSDGYKCCLDETWRFDEIDANARKRVGHEYEGRQHASIGELVVKAVYDIEAAFGKLHPNASCRTVADFWCSWQVQRHIVDFCSRLGESDTARLLAGDRAAATEQANRGGVHIYRQIAVFARDVLEDAAGSETGASASDGNAEPANRREPAGKRERGRPQQIPDERKAAAAAKKASGGTNRDAAMAIYNTRRPTPQQVKNVSATLKNYERKRSRLALPASRNKCTPPRPNKIRG